MISLYKHDNLSETLLKDNPEKYKYSPEHTYSEGVLFLVFTKRDSTSSS
ncbi:MAG TPA: hypothetical protein VLE21_06055 [Candidatus Nitrosocosmicus sp.]|nr:hypothetical protein [Candidatus Nitrosocosmicus sp.]